TGIGARLSRGLDDDRLRTSTLAAVACIALLAIAVVLLVEPIVLWAIPFSRPARILVAMATLIPIGVALGVPMPSGIRMLSVTAPQMVTWAWGINGALSVVGATL